MAYRQRILARDPLIYLPLDTSVSEILGRSTVTYSTGASQNVSIVDAGTTETGRRLGKAADFPFAVEGNGNNAVIFLDDSTNNDALLRGDMSLVAFAKNFGSDAGNYGLIGRCGGGPYPWGLYLGRSIEPTEYTHFDEGGGARDTVAWPSPVGRSSTWEMISFSRTKGGNPGQWGSIRLYVDGELVKTADLDADPRDNGNDVRIGSLNSSSQTGYGQIAQWQLYDRALTDDEMKGIYGDLFPILPIGIGGVDGARLDSTGAAGGCD